MFFNYCQKYNRILSQFSPMCHSFPFCCWALAGCNGPAKAELINEANQFCQSDFGRPPLLLLQKQRYRRQWLPMLSLPPIEKDIRTNELNLSEIVQLVFNLSKLVQISLS